MHYPDPQSLWGDYRIPHFSRRERGLFSTWLHILASNIIFAGQETIDRIQPQIEQIIHRTKHRELTLDQALKELDIHSIFSEKELFDIKETAESQGKMMAEFYSNEKQNN